MKLSKYLYKNTQCYELCAITDCGYIMATCWIDSEDLFHIPQKYADCEVKEESWGMLKVTTQDGKTVKVPCHYIEVG